MPEFWKKNKNKPKPEEPSVQVIKVIQGPPGPKGNSPTKEELMELIEILMPDPIPGENGTDYMLTEADRKEIAGRIKVPKVKPVIIEKTEVVRELPVLREVAKYHTAGEIRDLLESLKKGNKLSIQAIEGLAGLLKELSARGGTAKVVNAGSVSSRPAFRFVDDETIGGSAEKGIIDGVNTVFNLDFVPAKGSLKIYRGNGRMRVGEDYTLLAKTITFLIAPQVGEVLLADYRR